MGAGQVLGSAVGATAFQSSRTAIVLVSSLIMPLLFFVAEILFDRRTAIFAALFLALEPQHLGYSQMAHLDAVQTVLVFVTIACYLHAVERRSVFTKIIAGLFWGLSVATKPTAAALIPGFIAFKVIRNFLRPARGDTGERAIVSWSDVGAITVGHVVFAAIYTRLWVHDSDYLHRLEIRSRLADVLFALGDWLQSEQIIVALAAIAGTILAIVAYRRRLWRRRRCLLRNLSLRARNDPGARPQVIENLVRFWTWTSGLSTTKHRAFGHVFESPPYGYLGLFFSRATEVMLLGLVLALVFSLRSIRGRDSQLILSLLVISVLWLLPLEISPKKTWRYALPIVPLLWLSASWGFVRFLDALREDGAGERKFGCACSYRCR